MSGERMRAEMLEQPEALARLAERFEEHVLTVRTVVRAPLAGVVFEARGSSVAGLPLPGGVPEALAAFPATVRAQQLAVALADARGLDADAPVGLTKVTPTQ